MVLRRNADLVLDHQMREKGLNLGFHHLRRLAEMVEVTEALGPKAIGLLGRPPVMTGTLWPPWGRATAARPFAASSELSVAGARIPPCPPGFRSLRLRLMPVYLALRIFSGSPIFSQSVIYHSAICLPASSRRFIWGGAALLDLNDGATMNNNARAEA